MPYSHLATATNILWKLFEEYDLDPKPVYMDAGIDLDDLKKPGFRIEFVAVEKIWRHAIEAIPDPCFGLKAPKFWHPSYLHALGYTWLASDSLREALEKFQRYLHIVTEAGYMFIEEKNNSYSITIDFDAAGLRLTAQIDTLIALIMHMCRINYGEKLKPVSVSFQHEKPCCAKDYVDFFRAPVSFSENSDRITFFLEDIDKPLLGASPELARSNDLILIEYLANLEKDTVVHSVKSSIIKLLARGHATDTTVAQKMGFSVRNLQRKLKSTDTSFRAIKNETRKELATNYLRDPKIELSEIAFMLGYSEQSSFSRSFKRMTGFSPSEFRENRDN